MAGRSLLVCLLIVGMGSRAFAEPAEHHVTTAVPTEEVARPRPNIDPAIASRIFGARVAAPREETPPPVADEATLELDMSFDLPAKKEKKKWRPKIILWPLKSVSKGDGSGRLLGLKIRF